MSVSVLGVGVPGADEGLLPCLLCLPLHSPDTTQSFNKPWTHAARLGRHRRKVSRKLRCQVSCVRVFVPALSVPCASVERLSRLFVLAAAQSTHY